MSYLQQLPSSSPLSQGLQWGQGKKTTFAFMTSFEGEDLEALSKIEDTNLALFISKDALLLREQMEQDWIINLPKGKGQETLYSTTFFWNPASDGIEHALSFAQQKGWAVYTEVDGKLCMLVVNSRVGVDVDAEGVLGQLA